MAKVYVNKWVQEIVSLQHEDGSWGLWFHSMGKPTSRFPLTTEQALRRLSILGLTKTTSVCAALWNISKNASEVNPRFRTFRR